MVVGGGGVSSINSAGLNVLCPRIPSDVLFKGINGDDAPEIPLKSVSDIKVFCSRK